MPVLAIGDFDVFTDKILGKGGWGKVYLGRQRSLNRQVAVKFLNADMTRESDFVTRFRREAQCLASINDNHIIQVYGAGEHEGSQWFAMEFVDGATLQKFIDKGRKFEEPEVLVIGLAVARALKAAWNSPEKIVHRDIKPSNILVATGGGPEALAPYGETRKHGSSVMFTNFRNVKIKVMDFGLAKLKKEDNEKTLPGTVMGTPKYISPEQAQGKPADIRSDIYSLGVMLFQLATGRTPFEGDTAISLLSKHIYDEPPAPSSYDPKVSRELDSIVLKCLGKLPEERYQSPEALLDDMESFLDGKRPRIAMGEHTSVERADVSSTGVTILRRPAKSPARFVLVILFLAVAATAVLGFLPPDGVKRDFVGNLKAHWAKLQGMVSKPKAPGPKQDPDPVGVPGPNDGTTPVDPKALARRTAEEKLAEAARRADANDPTEARRLLEIGRAADPTCPAIVDVEAKVKDSETRASRNHQRDEAKSEFDRTVKDAREAQEPKDAVQLLERAVQLATEWKFEGLANAEVKLAEAREKASKAEEYSKILREASEEHDPVRALELFQRASKLGSDTQVTALASLIEKRKSDAADKFAQSAAKFEAERKLQEALDDYEKALSYVGTHKEASAGKDRVLKLIPAGVGYVRAGKFLSGEGRVEKELPPYWVQLREVTNDEYAAFLAAMLAADKEVPAPKSWPGGKLPAGQGSLPARGVSFADASEYARWKGPGWRLPTDDEWEKAARGEDGRNFPWGNDFAAGKANVAKFSTGPMAPGSMPGDVSPCGCFDMAGNVQEWTTTDYNTSNALYKNVKTLRGGRYDTLEKSAALTVRSPGIGADATEAGFRCVWTP